MTRTTDRSASRSRLLMTAAALVLAAGATGCINHSRQTMSARSMNNGVGDMAFAGFHRLNVGAGDALGAASFGTDVTVAKAKQFGNYDFATGSADFPGDD